MPGAAGCRQAGAACGSRWLARHLVHQDGRPGWAGTLAWLAEVRDRLRQFRREYGRRPRKRELALIVDGPP
jgi:hypothetical protein